MQSRFSEYGYRAHCFFGIGILPDDLCQAPARFAPLVLASMAFAALSRILAPLKCVADSVYVHAVKATPSGPGGSLPSTGQRVAG
jgi:hypothetical protein